MTAAPGQGRTDRASRLILASPQAIYRAFLDPLAWVEWLPPEGMSGEIHAFDAREGGAYRMTLTYDRADDARAGKSSGRSDVVEGRFVELVRDRRMVQAVAFVSEDPDFAGEMRMTWSLAPADGGTLVGVVCENVPVGIKPEDHDAGLRSTLGNLARFVERSSAP